MVAEILHKLILLIALFFSHTVFACVDGVTIIRTQTQFDEAVARINKGEEMHLLLRKGTFILKENLEAKAPLSIKGAGAVITCLSEPLRPQQSVRTTETHFIYKIARPLSLFPLFCDSADQLLPVSESVIDSTGVNYLEGRIEVSGGYQIGATVRIPIPSNFQHLRNRKFAKAYGYLDSGWETVRFSVEKSDGNYFYCTTLTECATQDFQYDKRVYKRPVRFVIYNAEVLPGKIFYDNEYLYVPKSVSGVSYLNNSDEVHKVPRLIFRSDVEILNVNFCGIGGMDVFSAPKALCHISSCHFSNTLGTSLTITKYNSDFVNEVQIEECSFSNCAVLSDPIVYLASGYEGDMCIKMSNCTVSRYPNCHEYYKNTIPSVNVLGNVTLVQNVFYNSCRGHIALNKGRIIVKENVLFNTDSFYRCWDRNTSNDWGLIYCNHIFRDTDKALSNSMHSILLENNLLYGAYAYGGDARGVFIDDGRGDVLCRGNIILNTQVYSIDARNTNLTDASSVRNCYEKNIVTSKYRLLSGPAVDGSNTPSTCANLLLTDTDNKTSNVRVIEEDTRVEDKNLSLSCDDSCIRVSKDLYRILKKSPAWKITRRYIRRSR